MKGFLRSHPRGGFGFALAFALLAFAAACGSSALRVVKHGQVALLVPFLEASCRDLPGTARRRTWLTLSGLWPLDDAWRLLAHVISDLPIDSLGKNQPFPITGVGATVIRSWS